MTPLLPDDTLVWLISGTTSGFGQRLVSAALARGDHVIATGRSQDKLDTMYGGGSTNLKTLRLDVTDGFDALKKVVEAAMQFWGKIDVLVNNAGNGYLGLMEETGSPVLRRQFDTNVFGVLDLTNATLPYMRARGKGTVVVIGSRTAWRADTASLGHYAASKAAVHAVTETLSVELAPLGIRVLLVAPGAFRTENIYAIPFHTSNPIPDYDNLREACISFAKSIPGTEPGDPVKAMELLVDVVRNEGSAKGKKWPTILLMGNDAERDFKNKSNRIMQMIEEWGQAIRNVWY